MTRLYDLDSKELPRGVKLIELPEYEDERGRLAVAEHPHGLPFVAKRFFAVYGVKSARVRGAHAHRKCQQFLICVTGRCSVVTDDGRRRREFRLDSPRRGLYLAPMVWAIQNKFSSNAVLLVFASESYEPADYIRDYEEFLSHRPATGLPEGPSLED